MCGFVWENAGLQPVWFMITTHAAVIAVQNALRDEVRGNKFFGFFVSGAYATRVKSFPLYHAVSQDIIRRWAYPLVPDSNLWGTKYKCAQHLVYREPEVTLQR